MTNKTKIGGWVGAMLLIIGTQAQAEITWRFDDNAGESFALGNTVSKTSGGVSATAQAWANTNNGVTTGSGSSGPHGSSSSSTAASYTLETAYLNTYSWGMGVKNQDASTDLSYGDKSETGSTEHSMDNNQRYDSVLFSFNSAIDLNSVTIGWKGTDSDISVLAYTGTGSCVGAGTCSADMSGKTYAQLANYGWSFIGHYTNLSINTAKDVNVDNVTSSYWLIGALNPLVSATNITKGNDYVKLLALSGDKYMPPCTPGTPGCGGKVPEPGTLLLMGAGLFGLTRMSRRKAA